MIGVLAIVGALGSVGLALLIGRAVRLGDRRDAAIARVAFLPRIGGLAHPSPPRREPWEDALVTHGSVLATLPASVRDDFRPLSSSTLTVRGPASAADLQQELRALGARTRSVEIRQLGSSQLTFLVTFEGTLDEATASAVLDLLRSDKWRKRVVR